MKVENHACAVALHVVHDGCARVHATLRVTPTLEASPSTRLEHRRNRRPPDTVDAVAARGLGAIFGFAGPDVGREECRYVLCTMPDSSEKAPRKPVSESANVVVLASGRDRHADREPLRVFGNGCIRLEGHTNWSPSHSRPVALQCVV